MVESFGRLSILLFGSASWVGAISDSSESEKKMGAASPSSESPALPRGVCDSIEAMEAPAVSVSAVFVFASGFVVVTTGLGEVCAAAVAGGVARLPEWATADFGTLVKGVVSLAARTWGSDASAGVTTGGL